MTSWRRRRGASALLATLVLSVLLSACGSTVSATSSGSFGPTDRGLAAAVGAEAPRSDMAPPSGVARDFMPADPERARDGASPSASGGVHTTPGLQSGAKSASGAGFTRPGSPVELRVYIVLRNKPAVTGSLRITT